MHTAEYPYAGLILPVGSRLDPEPYLKVAVSVLSRLDGASGQRPRRSRKRPAVMGDHYGLSIVADESGPQGPRLSLCAIARGGGMPQSETVAEILSDTVLEVLSFSPAERIEWFAPDVVIERAEFIRLRSYVSPRRKRSTPIRSSGTSVPSDSLHIAMTDPEIAGPVQDIPTDAVLSALRPRRGTGFGRMVSALSQSLSVTLARVQPRGLHKPA